jgi:GNAT superfamily N-acetyltransferase
MALIDNFRPEDKPAIESLYRRVFGNDAADASRLRWDWQYRRNPHTPSGKAPIWVAREGPALIGHYATMPVRLWADGQEIDASWGTDVMVAPERQRQGVGQQLVSTWDTHVGASLGLGLSDPSVQLFEKLRWPALGMVPCLVKPLTRRAIRRGEWPTSVNRLVSALTLPVVKVVARSRPIAGELEPTRRFDDGITRLWERVAPGFDFAVRRDAAYLQWKYIGPPHVRYSVVVLRRNGESAGYAVYRHAHEPRTRVTLLVDFLTDSDDREGLLALLRYVDREAQAADSDKIRCYCLHAGFRGVMKRSGYFQVKSSLQLVARINAFSVPEAFYRDTSRWHVTLGDSDLDR